MTSKNSSKKTKRLLSGKEPINDAKAEAFAEMLGESRWCYGLVKHIYSDHDQTIWEPYLAVHEVFFDKRTGEITGWTADPVDFGGEDSNDVIKAIEMCYNDLVRTPEPMVVIDKDKEDTWWPGRGFSFKPMS